MQGMEAREPLQPEPAPPWRAKLIPLQGSISDTDIEVTHMASRILTARCKSPLALGLPVRIDQRDSILLGEVVACREETPGEFSLLIEMNESLSGLHSLRKLVSALLGEARADEPVHPLDSFARRGSEADRRLRQR
jgi:hypothetical protein